MPTDTPEDAIERGLEAYVAGDALKELLDGVDLEALAEGAALDDAVEYEQLGRTLGRLVGRAATKGITDSGLLGRLAKETVGSEVGAEAGEAAAAALVEHGDPEAVAEGARALADPEYLDRFAEELEAVLTGAGVERFRPSDSVDEDWTEIEVQDADEG